MRKTPPTWVAIMILGAGALMFAVERFYPSAVDCRAQGGVWFFNGDCVKYTAEYLSKRN